MFLGPCFISYVTSSRLFRLFQSPQHPHLCNSNSDTCLSYLLVMEGGSKGIHGLKVLPRCIVGTQ